MRIAVIILAHLNSSSGVELIAKYFSGLDASLFVHVDKKSDVTSYQKACGQFKELFLVPNRIAVYWGGFSIVHAIVSSLVYARNYRAFDKFLLITENSIPLVPPLHLQAELSSDVEHMHILNGNSNSAIRSRYDGFYCFDNYAMNPRHCAPELRELTADVMASIDRLRQLKERGKPSVNLYHGSTYWALSHQLIESILDSYSNQIALREAFEFSAIPEEQYFHTIIMSRYAENKFKPFMYSDFSRPDYPYVFRTIADLTSRPNPSGLFLRKVDMTSSAINNFVEGLI